MAKNSPYSNIRSYAELESSLRMIHRQLEATPLSQGVSQLKAVPSQMVSNIDWCDVAVFAIRLLQNYLKK